MSEHAQHVAPQQVAVTIGLDRPVFLDDKPVERAPVRSEPREVPVTELPSDPAHYRAALPSIAIVIPTRNRGRDAADAARAVLKDMGDLELVVVDQSTNDETQEALSYIDDPRLSVIRSNLRGISNARNVGVEATSAPYIAFTDDDCRPRGNWPTSMLETFLSDPAAALVFGRVTTPPTGAGDFAPSFQPRQRVRQGRVPLPDEDIGIGANFAVRRSVLNQLGGFDPLLGAGAPHFVGAEETDILIRALHAGFRVVNTAESHVVHLGIRTGDDARRLIVAYRTAVGAAFGKNARLSGWTGIADCLRWIAFECRVILGDIARRRRPQPAALLCFVRGALLTFRYGIDHPSMRFRLRRGAKLGRVVPSRSLAGR